MKLLDLVKHLIKHGCIIERQGARHTVWKNPVNEHQSSVPRHREISNHLARAICIQLDIPTP
jgi:mRNA interferase HicA